MENHILQLGFLASHNGTDMQAIVGAIEKRELNAQAEVVISNNSKSPALEFARQHEIPSYHISSKTHENPDQIICETLLSHGVELVIFSGYMKVIEKDSPLLTSYKGRIWNPHPADTQKYPLLWGDAVHEAVLKNHEEYTYPTIHIVESAVDKGPVLAQEKVKVEPDDTVLSLKNRVQAQEIELLVNLLINYKNDFWFSR